MKRHPQERQQSIQLLNWLNSTINAHEVQIQQLGNGVSYCLLMYHYFPTVLNIKKVCLVPRMFQDFLNNLKAITQTLCVLKWSHITFDINKVANGQFQDNLQLLSKLYASFNIQETIMAKQRPKNCPTPTIQTLKKQLSMPAPLPRHPHSTHTHCPPPKMQKSQSLDQSQTSISQKQGSKGPTNTIEQIKSILLQKDKTDRHKVRELKVLLGIEVEQQQKNSYEDEADKNLLSQCNHKEMVVVIDQN